MGEEFEYSLCMVDNEDNKGDKQTMNTLRDNEKILASYQNGTVLLSKQDTQYSTWYYVNIFLPTGYFDKLIFHSWQSAERFLTSTLKTLAR